MDDIENLIYILFVLISLISGVWKNASKQKEEKKRRAAMEQTVAEDEAEEVSTWRPEPIPVVPTKKDEAAAERLEQMKRAAEEARSNRRLRKRNLLADDVLPVEEEAPKLASLHSCKSDFDAKKAVIYSEILNPPYL